MLLFKQSQNAGRSGSVLWRRGEAASGKYDFNRLGEFLDINIIVFGVAPQVD